MTNMVVFLVMFVSLLLKAQCHPYILTTTPSYGLYCGTTTLSGRSGSFTSPDYPRWYRNDERCRWDITVEQGYVVELTIEKYDIEENDGCTYDSLMVFDGFSEAESNELANLCGEKTSPTVVISPSNKMRVKFFTDESDRAPGFTATYRQIPCFPITLQKNGNQTWFKFQDDPQTSNLENALYSEEQSTQHYVGLSKKYVTFHVEAQSGEKFRFMDFKISTRFASEVVIEYEFMKKKSILKKAKSESIENSKEWTTTDITFDVLNVKSITVNIKWDTSLGKKMNKINVKDFMITTCEK